jgi:peptide-methionine (R)-S-oxide reductase
MKLPKPMTRNFKRDEEAIRKLSPEQHRVTQQRGTERPGTGEYLHNEEPGIYVDVVSGEPLFASSDKFDSGTGWPSFTDVAAADTVTTHEDNAFGMRRVEVRCANCDAHLGHVFPDGPGENGRRYCINGCALELDTDAGSGKTST